MKAIVLKAYGGFDQLRYEDVPQPEPGMGEVVIRIHATGVNHCDTDVRRGVFGVAQTFPHVMGVDAAGEIAAVGPGVVDFKVGDRVAPHFLLTCGTCRNCRRGLENICSSAQVLGVTIWGTYAQFVKVGQHDLARIPGGLSYEDAVAAQVPFATAWEGLITVAGLRAGESVLINAAGGGVGSAAVQVAKLAGAHVIATTGSDEKFAMARQLGADEVLNYSTSDVPDAVMRLTGGQGVDVAFDMVGGERLLDCVKAVADGGRIASIGAHGGEQVLFDMIEFFRKHISLHGCGRSTKAIVDQILPLVAAGKLKPVIFKEFGLQEAAEAHAVMEGRNFFGRMILRP